MIVFEYLYDMMDVLGPMMNKWAESYLANGDEVGTCIL